MSDTDLEQRLQKAHSEGAPGLLAGLYAEAAEQATDADDAVRAGFFLTQAWVFALEAGVPEAETLRAKLIAQGRESET